jgi:hypothetical protein
LLLDRLDSPPSSHDVCRSWMRRQLQNAGSCMYIWTAYRIDRFSDSRRIQVLPPMYFSLLLPLVSWIQTITATTYTPIWFSFHLCCCGRKHTRSSNLLTRTLSIHDSNLLSGNVFLLSSLEEQSKKRTAQTKIAIIANHNVSFRLNNMLADNLYRKKKKTNRCMLLVFC